jgi:hypothetical protein
MCKEAFFMSKASNKLSLQISLNNFSFSQLIIAVMRMFDAEGIRDFVNVLVTLIESIFIIAGVSTPFRSYNP